MGRGILSISKKETTMFTEITGNAELFAEDGCGCNSRCTRNCIISCDYDELLTRAALLEMDMSMISGMLSF
jgi:hypothetical protein